MTTLWTILTAVNALAALACILHVLRYYRRPAAAIAWIFAVVVLPGAGPILYLMIAVYDGPRRLRRRAGRAASLRRASAQVVDADEAGDDDADASFPMMQGHSLEFALDGDRALELSLEAIHGAQDEVLLQTYALHDDPIGSQLTDALLAARERGARVLMLVDPIGSLHLPRGHLQHLVEAGLEIGTFLKPNPLKGRFQINSRNHRKSLVVDGNLAVTGGRNWGAQYFGAPGYRDLTLRIEGPAVAALRRVFIEDWCIESGVGPEQFPRKRMPPRTGDIPMRVVPHGVDETVSRFTAMAAGALRSAKHRVDLLTPYFVPGPVMQDHLAVAARAGVRVRIVIAQETDSRTVNLASRYYFDRLLHAGAQIVVVPKPMIHGKALVVDDRWCTTGSTNFDCRSFHLNYELNVEIPHEGASRELRGLIDRIADEGTSIDPAEFGRRGGARRMVEKAAALFEPIL